MLAACETGMKKEMQPAMNDLKAIGVFPFFCMDCAVPFDGQDIKTIGENASSVMTEHLVNILSAKTGLNVTLMPELKKKDVEALSYYSGVMPLEGYNLKEAFLIGRIFHYKDRKGGNYSVSEPSRVAFDMKIIRISDGHVLFHCEFDETQKPLLSNILNIGSFMKRKGRWVEAEEMALKAIDDALEEYISDHP
jgi:hypothetical protein